LVSYFLQVLVTSVSLLCLAGLFGEYFDQRACLIGEHSGNQNSCSWARRICAVDDIHQGLI